MNVLTPSTDHVGAPRASVLAGGRVVRREPVLDRGPVVLRGCDGEGDDPHGHRRDHRLVHLYWTGDPLLTGPSGYTSAAMGMPVVVTPSRRNRCR